MKHSTISKVNSVQEALVCEISNFNMWTTKHLAQPSCTELTLTKVGNSNVKTGKEYTKKLSGNFQEPVN